MRIEDVYQQLSIFTFMNVFTRIGNSYLSKQYESYGFGYGQHQFLLALYAQDGLSQEELTKRIAVDKATTTRAVNKLKELGYFNVTGDCVDKRVKRVTLTEKALDQKEDILEIARGWEDYFLNKLNEQDKKELLALCHKIVTKPEGEQSEEDRLKEAQFRRRTL